jgi:hypothetical protein
VSHLTFFPQAQQSPELVAEGDGILGRYRALAEKVRAEGDAPTHAEETAHA